MDRNFGEDGLIVSHFQAQSEIFKTEGEDTVFRVWRSFEKYAPSKQTAKAVALCGDAKHQTPQPQGGFCCTPYYHLPNHQIQRTRGGYDDSSIPSDDECPKLTYEEEIHQSHTLIALDKMHHKRHCHFHSNALHRRTYFSMITPALWAKNPVHHLTLPVHQKITLAQGEVVLHMKRR